MLNIFGRNFCLFPVSVYFALALKLPLVPKIDFEPSVFSLEKEALSFADIRVDSLFTGSNNVEVTLSKTAIEKVNVYSSRILI